MPRISLTDARVAALTPRKTAYDIRDSKLRGFGVRVLPSGRKHFFVHCQHREVRVWRIVGDASSTGVHEARLSATEMLAAIRRGETMPLRPDETLFEAVAEAVFQRYERVWKPRTLYVNRHYLRRQILPHFAGRPIADINAQDVRNWFAFLRGTPVAADRSMPVLSVIMSESEAMSLRPEGSNPCRGIRRYRRKERERFLSDDEIRRLSKCLSAQAERRPRHVAVIRLLLLTGCRKSEILTLRWSDYREGHLFLRDSKTGPRTVWLSQPGLPAARCRKLTCPGGQGHGLYAQARGPVCPLPRGRSHLPDNNAAERALRGIALGRKSWRNHRDLDGLQRLARLEGQRAAFRHIVRPGDRLRVDRIAGRGPSSVR